jgi:MFS transporter, DHA2 family, multidrug resistance protein
MSWNLASMVLFRLAQGICGAPLVPLSQAILLDAFPHEKRGQALAAFGFGIMVAPILGPTLGGWLTDTFSWRAVFYINVPIGLFALLLFDGALALRADESPQDRLDGASPPRPCRRFRAIRSRSGTDAIGSNRASSRR